MKKKNTLNLKFKYFLISFFFTFIIFRKQLFSDGESKIQSFHSILIGVRKNKNLLPVSVVKQVNSRILRG